MNKVMAGLLGAVGLALVASTSVTVAAPVLTDGARVQDAQYAYGDRPAYRPSVNRHYRHSRQHFSHRGHGYGRSHGRPHFAGGYPR